MDGQASAWEAEAAMCAGSVKDALRESHITACRLEYNFNIPDNSSSHSLCYDQACGPRVKSWLCLFLASVTEASSTLFCERGHRTSPRALGTMNGHKALVPHLKACSKHSLNTMLILSLELHSDDFSMKTALLHLEDNGHAIIY